MYKKINFQVFGIFYVENHKIIMVTKLLN